jgi:hypothetical protein
LAEADIKKALRINDPKGLKKTGNVLLSHSRVTAVPSTSVGLTSVFGMGTGVTPPEKLPENLMTIMKYSVIQKLHEGKI